MSSIKTFCSCFIVPSATLGIADDNAATGTGPAVPVIGDPASAQLIIIWWAM